MSGTGPGPDFLVRRAAATPGRTALVGATDGRRWTVRELDRRVDAFAADLRAVAADRGTDSVETGGEPPVDGSRAGSSNEQSVRVGIALPPRPAFVVAFYATLRLGWTVVALDPRWSRSSFHDRIDRTGPAVVVCDGDTAAMVPGRGKDGNAADAAADAPATVSVDPAADRAVACQTVDPFAGPPAPTIGADTGAINRGDTGRDPDETVLLAFTSGTTGEPRAVRLTTRNLAASATASALRLGVDPEDRWLACLPVAHVGGLSPAVRCVVYGTTLVFQPGFEPARTAAAIDEFGVTGVSLVPTQLRRLLDADGDAGGSDPAAALASLDTVLLGGAPASDDLLSRASETGIPVFPTYGLTETASQVATARPAEARAHPGTVGQPLYGTRVTVVDDGAPVAPGERGEIVVDGPTVTPGYLDAELTAATFGDHGLHTGDVGYRDADGRLWVLGRQDDLVVSGGELVAPATVAAALRAHPAVEDAAVVGLADPEWGERVSALVVADPSVGAEGLREHCRERLADFEVPKAIAFTETIPRTASGTVDRDAVREQFDGST